MKRSIFVPAILGILLGVTITPTVARNDIRLPDIGAPSDSVITPAEEQRLGKAFMRSLREQVEIVDDPLLTEYINELGQRLVQHAGNSSDRGYRFFVVDNAAINAFAGPAGYIGLHTGLILATQSESELASVLAHEIAHVEQKHLLRRFGKAREINGKTIAMMLAGIALGAAVSPQLGQAAVIGAQAGAAQAAINFTRANEEEADRIGIRILADAGFDPRTMPAFFDRLSRASRLYNNSAPEFLRTHPVSTNRLADAMARAEHYPYRQYPENPDYELMRTRLKARQFDNARAAVTAFRSSLKEGRYRDKEAQRYGYVLALIRQRDHKAASREVVKLLEKSPSKPAYLLAEAEIALLKGDLRRALDVLARGLKANPYHYPLTIRYAALLLKNRENAKTRRTLLDILISSPTVTPEVYDLLSQATGRLGRIAEAHRYKAEYFYLLDDLEAAIQQLKLVPRAKDNDFYETAKAEARLAEFEAELEDSKKRP